jgi:hypothetical protein
VGERAGPPPQGAAQRETLTETSCLRGCWGGAYAYIKLKLVAYAGAVAYAAIKLSSCNARLAERAGSRADISAKHVNCPTVTGP